MTEKREISGTQPHTINSQLAKRIQEELGQNVYLCYQCVKCTSGCPVSQFFDYQPNQIMRSLQLGVEQIALESQTPWLCASCLTCTTRCPQGLDITAIMEFLTREVLERGMEPQVPATDHFNKAFMREVNIWGRSYEPGLMAELILRRPQSALEDLPLYLKFFQKGKVDLIPHPVRMPSKKKIKHDPGAEKAVAYYPGCSLESTASEYDRSTHAVCQALGLELVEPRGWVCCGSSAAHRADPEAALRLPLENLSLMERIGYREVTMPCAACYNRHKAAQYEIRRHPDKAGQMAEKMGREYEDTVHVSTLVEALSTHVGPAEVSRRVKKPLKDLHLVSYYGCLLTRPPEVTQSPHPENPTDLDQLMEALGAEVHDWSYKTTCCGAGHSLTRPDIVVDLSGTLINQAKKAGAEAIVVACPLCHLNLDARQFQMEVGEPLPIFYFTQLMAVALDLPPKTAALKKNVVDPHPLLVEKCLWNQV